jgi:intracellular sulfur oxidation DsrE/DsrF family protein
MSIFLKLILLLLISFSVILIYGRNAFSSTHQTTNTVPYFKHKTLKELYVVSQNPKKWPLLLSDISNAIIYSNRYFFRYKIIVVGYGPGGIKFFMNKYDKKNYPAIQSYHTYGVKFVTCHLTMKTLGIKKSQLFKFVKIAYPGAVFYIFKLKSQGYVNINY